MVNREVVIATIEKMAEAGIEEESIRETLKGIGLKDSEIDAYLDEVLGPAEEGEAESGAQETEEANPEHESIASKTASKVNPEIDKFREEQGLYSTHAQIALDEHSQKLDEMHSKIDNLSTMASQPQSLVELTGKINAIAKQLSFIEKNVSESKAALDALQSLMQKILSNERDLMLEFSGKKSKQ